MAGAMIHKQSLQTHRELGVAIGVSKNDNNRTAIALLIYSWGIFQDEIIRN